MLKCRICKGNKFTKLLSLGNQALANNLPKKKIQSKKYPLEIYQCNHCSLIQLGYVVPKKKMYDEYFYVPSVSKTHLKHFEELAKSLILACQLKQNDLVVDIGSSDGSLLSCFQRRGMDVYGVEPAKNIGSSVHTYRQYFSPKTAHYIVRNAGKAKLVTATNSFAHIDDLHTYLQALDVLLAEDGVFFAQFPDVRNLLQENQFDTIYHEHLSYFTYEPLHHLFANSPFELFHIDSTTMHGGSMGIYVRRRKPLIKSFISSTHQIKKTLTETLRYYKKQGKKVVGFGAAAKGMVLLQYCNLDTTLLKYVVDATPYKQGRYTSGTNIPIYPETQLEKDKPDVILILAWNFKEEIMEKLKGKGYTFIIPIPEVKICE